MYRLLARCALVFIVFLVSSGSLRAEPTIEVQTVDGRKFQADFVQIGDDRVFLTTKGLPPIELPLTQVRCFGQACLSRIPSRTTAPDRAPGHIGFRGDSAIANALMPKLLEAYAASVPFGAAHAQYDRALGRSFTRIVANGNTVATVDLYPGDSNGAFQGLRDDAHVIGMSSRAIAVEEARALLETHHVDMTSAESEHVVALEAIAVIVNAANPVAAFAFSKTTLAKIFSGEISDWSAVGGRPGQIKLYATDTKSAPYGAFADMVMTPAGLALSNAAKSGGSSADVGRRVEADPNAIGFVDFQAIGGNRGLAIKDACGLGQKPTIHRVKSEIYPLSRRLYLYTAGRPADAITGAVVDFVMSEAAQRAVAAAGFIDQDIVFEAPAEKEDWIRSVGVRVHAGTPQAGIDGMIADAQAMRRSSVSLRFRAGSPEFDTKARRDLRRIAALLKTPVMAGRRWTLVGFADASSAYSSNYGLSQRRAAAAAAELAKLGVPIGKENIVARSWLNPDACGVDETGRRVFDRRVEFWVEDKAPTSKLETGALTPSGWRHAPAGAP